MDLRLSRFPHRGPLPWVLVTAGIAFWAIHLVACAALATPSCHHKGLVTVIHVLTVVLGLLTLAAAYGSYRLMRHEGHAQFLGILGVTSNAISFLLILLEGLYVIGIHPCVQ